LQVFLDVYIVTCRLNGTNGIGGVMVRVSTWNAVDHCLDPRPRQTKDGTIGICCFTIMCPFGAKYPRTDYCIVSVIYRVGPVQSASNSRIPCRKAWHCKIIFRTKHQNPNYIWKAWFYLLYLYINISCRFRLSEWVIVV
jgi:hypothetical protein